MEAILAENLTKKYKNKIAVDRLNLTIEEGELFTLLGVNGAGKTTTIKMLTCLTEPDSGNAYLMGNSINSEQNKVKEIINISPQETAVAGNLTVRENLILISGIYGSDKKEAESKADEMIEKFNLNEKSKSKAKSLSGGMQRRLSIAMSLISNPKILFLDEPTLGLDVLARRDLWEEIVKLKGKITIVLTTHYMEEAEVLSDRVGIMADGKLKKTATVEELLAFTESVNLEEAFVKLASGKEVQK